MRFENDLNILKEELGLGEIVITESGFPSIVMDGMLACASIPMNTVEIQTDADITDIAHELFHFGQMVGNQQDKYKEVFKTYSTAVSVENGEGFRDYYYHPIETSARMFSIKYALKHKKYFAATRAILREIRNFVSIFLGLGKLIPKSFSEKIQNRKIERFMKAYNKSKEIK